jgi:hypothetical protein
LVPVAAVRKLMVMFMTDEQAMSNGFNPPSEAAERFLRGLMRLELKGWRLPECGTSLCVVAKRRESVEEVKTAYQQGVR